MSAASSAPAISVQPPGSRPWLALALTFLILGAAYALPFQLVPASPQGLWQNSIAPEILNLYACTAFFGWAHFVYAWRGQLLGTKHLPTRSYITYWIAIAATISILIALRSLLGVALFSALTWIWFIAHFVKAERIFAGLPNNLSSTTPPISNTISLQPVAAFALLSLTLFNVAGIANRPWLLFTLCLATGAAILLFGGWKALAHGTSFLPALALFFTGEAFVWGSYSRYMHPAFRIGVYVFHVAGASFFHYLGSYAFGQSHNRPKPDSDRWLYTLSIVAVNLAVAALCCAVAWLPALHLLNPLLSLEWFTLWVAAHLASSDLLPIWKRHSHPPNRP